MVNKTLMCSHDKPVRYSTENRENTGCPKKYWTTLEKIINKKKFSNIPLLLENGVFVNNFQMKANIFNDHFVEQCSLINNKSALPNFVSRCNSSLSDVEITGVKNFCLLFDH